MKYEGEMIHYYRFTIGTFGNFPTIYNTEIVVANSFQEAVDRAQEKCHLFDNGFSKVIEVTFLGK